MLDRRMAKFPEAIPPQDVIDFLSIPRSGKVQLNLRVTPEAVEILEAEASRIGTGRAYALEAILREIRELRKRRKK